MSRRLTEAELREPDVRLYLTYGSKHKLPRRVQEALNTYGHGYAKGNSIVYVLPGYRAREIEAMMEDGN